MPILFLEILVQISGLLSILVFPVIILLVGAFKMAVARLMVNPSEPTIPAPEQEAYAGWLKDADEVPKVVREEYKKQRNSLGSTEIQEVQIHVQAKPQTTQPSPQEKPALTTFLENSILDGKLHIKLTLEDKRIELLGYNFNIEEAELELGAEEEAELELGAEENNQASSGLTSAIDETTIESQQEEQQPKEIHLGRDLVVKVPSKKPSKKDQDLGKEVDR